MENTLKRITFASLLFLCMSTQAWGQIYNFEENNIYYQILSASGNDVGVWHKSGTYYQGNVVIPPTVTRNGVTYNITQIGFAAFNGCNGITSVYIPEGVIDIESAAFFNCAALTSVYIPASVELINGSQWFPTFSNCPNLRYVHVARTDPCNISNDVFGAGLNLSLATLIVPPGTVNAYKQANGWRNFGTVVESSLTVPLGILNFSATEGGVSKSYNILASGIWQAKVKALTGYDPSWCEVVTNATNGDVLSIVGVGNGAIAVRPKTNNNAVGAMVRAARIEVTNGSITQSFNVRQEMAAPTLTLSATSVNLSAGATSQTLNVTSNNRWTASVSYQEGEWLRTSPSSATGNGSFSIIASANLTGAPRMATITVSVMNLVRTISVIQPPVTLSLSSSSLSFERTATGSQTVTVNSTVGWSLTKPGWLTVAPASNTFAAGTTTLTITPSNNTGAERMDSIIITADTTVVKDPFTGNAIYMKRQINVNQRPNPALSVFPRNISFAAKSPSDVTATVTTFGDWRVSVRKDSWLTVTPSSGSGNGTFTVSAVDNIERERRDTITLTNGDSTIIVTASQDWGHIVEASAASAVAASNVLRSHIDDNSIRYAHLHPEDPSDLNIVVVHKWPDRYSGAVTIPATVNYGGVTYNVVRIEDGTFWDCYDMTSITVPNSVTSIGENAFVGCNGLTSVTLPNSITTIGHGIFGDCANLTTVVLPNRLTSTGKQIFEYCHNLRDVTLPDSVRTIEGMAFYDCTVLDSLVLPAKLETLGHWTFERCFGLTSIVLPGRVSQIGKEVFGYCSSLRSITIPASLTSIGNLVFHHCDALRLIEVGWETGWSNPVDPFSIFSGSSSGIYIDDDSDNIINYTFPYSAATIVVPQGRKAHYENTYPWQSFGKVIPKAYPDTLFIKGVESLSDTLTVTTHLKWGVTTNVPWLTVSPATGAGSDSLVVTATANGSSDRYGVITLANQTPNGTNDTVRIMVEQEARPQLSLSEDTLTFAASGSTKQVDIIDYAGWTVTVPPADASWLTVSPPLGSVPATLSVTATLNANVARSSNVVVSNGIDADTLHVIQAANPALGVSPGSFSVGENTSTTTVTVTAFSEWTVSVNPADSSWLKVSATQGNGNGTFVVTSEHNEGAARTGTISVANYGSTATITVTQAVSTGLTLSSYNIAMGENASSTSVMLTGHVPWTLTIPPEAAGWLTITPASADASATLNITVAANDSTSRTADVIISNGSASTTLRVVQALGTSISASPGILSFAAVSMGNATIVVRSFIDWIATVPPDDSSWLRITAPQNTGIGRGEFTVTVFPNLGAQRSSVITIYNGITTKTITVTQPAGPINP